MPLPLAPISKTNLIYFLQFPVNGARGLNGQNAASHAVAASGNAPEFATTRPPSMTGRDAKATRLKRRLATRFVRPSMENGRLGHLGLRAAQIVCNFAEEIAITPNPTMAEGTAKATNWPDKIAREECANVSNIFPVE